MFSSYFLTCVAFMSFIQAENILYPPYTCTTTTTVCKPGQQPPPTVPPSREMHRRRGMDGLPGVKGEKGDSCQCNVTDRKFFEELRREVQDLKTENREIMRQMANLTTDNQQIKQEIQNLTTWNKYITAIEKNTTTVKPTATVSTSAVPTGNSSARGTCDVTYISKCFKTIAFFAQNVTLEDAGKYCAEINGEPANIYDVTHYQLLRKNLSEKKPVRLRSILWTGMKYQNNQLKLRSGENHTLPAEVWYPGYPYEDDADWKNILLDVIVIPDEFEGILNVPPSWNRMGVICEN